MTRKGGYWDDRKGSTGMTKKGGYWDDKKGGYSDDTLTMSSQCVTLGSSPYYAATYLKLSFLDPSVTHWDDRKGGYLDDKKRRHWDDIIRSTGMTLSWMESYFHDIILFPGSK